MSVPERHHRGSPVRDFSLTPPNVGWSLRRAASRTVSGSPLRGTFRRRLLTLSLAALFGAASSIPAPVRANEPELPPILIPPASDDSATPLFIPDAGPTQMKTRKVTPLDVTPVPSTIPSAPSTTIPPTAVPNSTFRPSTIPLEPLPTGPLSPTPERSTIPGGGFGPLPTGPLPTGPFNGPSLMAAPGHGLHIVIGEDFANGFVSTQRTDQGPVSDCILGARVNGCQTTDTRTRINFQPCERMTLGQLELLGNTRNQTRATTPQAAIDTTGDAQFLMTKALEFNGRQVATRSPAAFLVTSQQIRGAQTQLSGVPLLGPLASAYATSVANQQRPESERIAAYKITEQVVPQFNTAVDEQLTRLNTQLGTLFARLASQRLEPASLITRSTEQGMIVSAQVTNEEAGTPSTALSEQGLSIVLHENLIRGALRRLPLEGMQIPDTQLKALGDQLTTLLGGTPPAADPAVPLGVATFVLGSREPVAVRYQNGLVEISVVMSVQAAGAARLGERAITLRIRIDVEPESLRITPEPVDIRTLEPGEAAVDEVANTIIRKSIESQFQPFSVPRRFTIPLEEGRVLPVALAEASPRDGWLVIRLMTEAPPAAMPSGLAIPGNGTPGSGLPGTGFPAGMPSGTLQSTPGGTFDAGPTPTPAPNLGPGSMTGVPSTAAGKMSQPFATPAPGLMAPRSRFDGNATLIERVRVRPMRKIEQRW